MPLLAFFYMHFKMKFLYSSSLVTLYILHPFFIFGPRSFSIISICQNHFHCHPACFFPSVSVICDWYNLRSLILLSITVLLHSLPQPQVFWNTKTRMASETFILLLPLLVGSFFQMWRVGEHLNPRSTLLSHLTTLGGCILT